MRHAPCQTTHGLQPLSLSHFTLKGSLLRQVHNLADDLVGSAVPISRDGHTQQGFHPTPIFPNVIPIQLKEGAFPRKQFVSKRNLLGSVLALGGEFTHPHANQLFSLIPENTTP